MHRQALTALAVAIIVGSVLLGVDGGDQVRAQTTGCQAGTLNGRYGITGTGAFGDQDLGLIGTLVFDGAGGVTGHGTAAFHAVALVEHLVLSEGRYSLKSDCTGSIRFFTHHVAFPVVDHYHVADLVVSDAGQQLALIYVATEFRDGAPPTPVESFAISGQHM